jgi:alpha-beta hydrolase superfamily lysophospholipase
MVTSLGLSSTFSHCYAVEKQVSIDFRSILSPEVRSVPDIQNYTARDNVKLDFRYYPASSSTVLILVHGSAGHSRYLSNLAHSIAENGVAQVYTPDLRGHGRNVQRRGDVDYIGQLDDDLGDFIKYIRSKFPTPQKIILGGHSSGRGFVLHFSQTKYAEEISGYVLLAPYLGHDAPTTRPGNTWAQPNIATIVALDMLNVIGITWFNDLTAIQFNVPDTLRNGTETATYSYRLFKSFRSYDFKSELRAIQRPLLVIVGGNDELLNASEFPRVISQLNKGATVKVVSDCNHMSLVDPCNAYEIIGKWVQN